ncbi:MAG: hypothetical protein EBR82_00575 [Caulobacteraceae bacterium]|nr:hypothetical protein [Caulobacteraceae bacterium]
MSGILNNRSRVIDAILTSEGRRQMAAGNFDVKYVTFSDMGVSYIPDPSSGHEDPTPKIYFEVANLPQDQITFEANDEGKLVPFRYQDIKTSNNSTIPSLTSQASLINGQLVSYQYHHGRRVQTSTLLENPNDLNCGFVYSDLSNVTGSVLIDPKLVAGTITKSGPPYVAYIGSAGGLGSPQFASAISGAIASLTNIGGPDVNCIVYNNSVFLDTAKAFLGTKIFLTGTLSSPLIVEEGVIGGNLLTDSVQNADFATQIKGILTSSFDNFNKQQLLASIDRFYGDQDFVLSTNNIQFDTSKLDKDTRQRVTNVPQLNNIDSIFNDGRFSHLDNFLYLPPIVKVSDSVAPDKSNVDSLKPYYLGNYPSWGDNHKKLSFADIKQLLTGLESSNLEFVMTSNSNNVIGQLFEVNGTEVTKLDIVEYGDILNAADSKREVTNRVFFVGKTYVDDRGTNVFINIFTLVFSRPKTIR